MGQLAEGESGRKEAIVAFDDKAAVEDNNLGGC